ncbi:hypothetical protein PEC18_30775 [Paucibacter sp. O1-1]|nr:hypothetical protein [Paucibacter sp. O1-1]MDA3830092.1 hypothetical protein [Paucibacter sp. O1-1]
MSHEIRTPMNGVARHGRPAAGHRAVDSQQRDYLCRDRAQPARARCWR